MAKKTVLGNLGNSWYLASMVNLLKLNQKHKTYIAFLMGLTFAHQGFAADLTLKQKLDQAYQEREQAGLLTGAAIGLVDGDQITTYLYGDIKSAQDHLEIGSISKSFAGIMLARLVINKTIDLNAPLQTYVPELKDTWAGLKITAQLLATHSAQLPDDLTDGTDVDHEIGLVQYLKTYTPDTTIYAPGDRHYSNIGFNTIGLIIKRSMGEGYQSLVRTTLLDAFVMEDSGFLTDNNIFPLLLTPHNILMEPTFKDLMTDVSSAAGGIFSTLANMTNYLRANLHPELFPRQKDAILLSQKLGLGWDSLPGVLPLWKNGAMSGYGSYLTFNPATGIGAIGLTNDRNTDSITKLVNIALGEKDTFVADQKPSDEMITSTLGKYDCTTKPYELNFLKTNAGFLGAKVSVVGTKGEDSFRLRTFDGKTYYVFDGLGSADQLTFSDTGLVYKAYNTKLSTASNPVYDTLLFRKIAP